MALISCPECGKQVSDAASACPNCAYPISKPAAPRPSDRMNTPPPAEKTMGTLPKILLLGGGLFAAFIALGAMVGNTPEGKEKSQKRAAIEICWEEQKRKSLSAGEAQLIAGACETMEQEFVQKFRVRP